MNFKNTLIFPYEQVVYMALVGSFPFNSFLSGVLSCIGTAVLAGKWQSWLANFAYLYTHTHTHTHTYILLQFETLNPVFLIIVMLLYFGPVCLRIQVNKENKEFKVKIPFMSILIY